MSGHVLALLEQREGVLAGPATELASAAASLAAELDSEAAALILGGPGIAEELSSLGGTGLARVKAAVAERLTSYHPDGYLDALRQLIGEAGVVLLSGSDQGKDLAPRLAASLDVPLVQDATALAVDPGGVVITRPVYAGKALETLRVDAVPVIVTLRPGSFPVTLDGGDPEVEVVPVDVDAEAWPTELLSFEAGSAEIPDVAEATIVVSGGRGMRGPENWSLLERLREALGPEAGLGASRAVVDAGWRPHSEQVGQTGKTVSPRIYFAIGISGAIQHLAGMRTSHTIVAINRDPDAPIFSVADYGVVGDAFEVVPRLTEEIEALGRAS